ncbi:MAG: D-alanyl-D-alanine carboxypeptidase [Oscillospiraceae bacterium]|nr:D-alanyl-D-alanine carboxypeptidase [Oscillospiraceae bacterium]
MVFKKADKKTAHILLSALLCLLAVAPLCAQGTNAPGNDVKVHMANTSGLQDPPDVTAAAAILLNAATGDVIYEKNIGKIVYPASTVKIMTAIVVLENVGDLKSEVAISRYVSDYASGNLLAVRMSEGEIFTVEDLLNALLLRGVNDAALALSEYVAENVTDFVVLMNKKAVELGCTDTVFINPTGLDSPDMHTTASDTAKIAFYASKIQAIMDITSSPKYDIPPTNKYSEPRPLPNRNHFVSKNQYPQYYYEYAKGMNYGSTEAGGDCLVTIAQQNDLSYLCVVMNSTSTPIPGSDSYRLNCFGDAKDLFEWAFSIYGYKTLLKTTDVVKTVSVRLAANRDEVTLCPDRDIAVLLPQNADINNETDRVIDIFEDDLVAPIEKGQQLGKITILYNGEEVGSAGLVSLSEVERSYILYVLDQIKNIVSGGWFTASVVIFVAISAIYVVVGQIRKSKKEQRKFY